MTSQPAPVVQLQMVDKEYLLGRVSVRALSEVSLTLERGEFIVFAGPSGSGKTTLLNLIGCVDVPTRGKVLVEGQDTFALSERRLTQLRRRIGFIFQSFNLIAVLTAFQNVEFPLLLGRRVPSRERRERVRELLDQVGLEKHMSHRPGELSGGQRQRVAIARALVTRPELVLADEPTANLDSKTGQEIVELMQSINQRLKTSFILSTHDPAVIGKANRVVRLLDGRICN